MNNCYIGVGGIGCRLLKEYEKTPTGRSRLIYIDAVPDDTYLYILQNWQRQQN